MKFATAPGTRTRSSYDSLIVVTLGVCLIAMLVGLAFDHGTLSWTVGLISALPPFVVAWAAAKQKCALTPYALFATAYGAYNGLLLVRLAFLDAGEFPYPIAVPHDTVLKAAILSALGSISIATVWLLRSDRGPVRGFCLPPGTSRIAFRIGILFLIISFAFYWLQLRQVGGFVEAIRMGRVERFQMMRSTYTVPYIPFAATAISLLLVGSRRRVRLRLFTWIVVTLWIGLLVLQGERSIILQYILTGAGTLAAMHPGPFRLSKTNVSIIVAIILTFLVFEQVRPFISFIMSGEGSVFLQERAVDHLDPFSFAKPEKTEFGGPYLSMFDAVSGHHPLLLGESYLDTVPAFLPRFLYPGQKPIDLANQLAENVSGGDIYVMGWGYTATAEAYRNFGLLGVPLIMAAWSMFFLWLSSIHGRHVWGLFLPPLMLINAILVNRIDFRAVYINAVFSLGALVLAVACLKILAPDHNYAKNRLSTCGAKPQ
jgi:hypothetical protein